MKLYQTAVAMVLGSVAFISIGGCTIREASVDYDRPIQRRGPTVVEERPVYVAPPPPGPVVYQPVPYQPTTVVVQEPPPPTRVIVVQQAPPQQIVVVRQTPPAAYAELVPVRPAPGYVWTSGYWVCQPTGWVWVGGQWVVPPRPTAVYVPPRWDRDTGGSFHFSVGIWK